MWVLTVKARGAAQYPIVSRMAPSREHDPAPNFRGAQVEKPALMGATLIGGVYTLCGA